jgi:hypothetical protein
MKRYQLSLDDLVRGLEFFGERYQALDVFTRDLQELGRGLMAGRTGEAWRAKDDSAFVFERGGRSYKLRFHPWGIARLTRAEQATHGPSEHEAAPGPLSAALQATVFDRWLPAAVVGFLVGPPLSERADASRRVFTMHFDPLAKEWGAYDGPLLGLVREKREEADAAFRSVS